MLRCSCVLRALQPGVVILSTPPKAVDFRLPWWQSLTELVGLRTGAPRDSPSLTNSFEEGPPFSETGHPLAPTSRSMEPPCMGPGRDAAEGLKYVAAISAHHDLVESKTVGQHDLVVRFLRGARRLNPPHSPLIPSWDLAVLLSALLRAPFEPL
ncbi:hypothetical protein PO909_024614 [Leuciscus waleckii]